MTNLRCWLFFGLCIFLLNGNLAEAADAPDGSTISGTISVYRTKVKTEGAKSGKEVVVYLEDLNGKVFPPVDALLEMDQKGLVFIPHVLPIQKGATVRFLNNDQVLHNVYFLFESTGETLDIGTWGYGISKDHQFTVPDKIITLCKIHLEMAAHIIVLDNPYYTTAIIDAETQQATYDLTGIPPGQYRLKAWHKKLKMKGKYADITIAGGENKTLDIVITKAKYAK